MKTTITFSRKSLKNTLFFGLIIFAFLKPDSLEYIGLAWLDKLLVLIDVAVMAVLMVMMLFGKFSMSKCSMIILAIYFFVGVFTAMGEKDFFSLMKVGGTSFGFALFTDYLIQKKPEIYFKASISVLLLLFTINLYTIIMYYPIGMYETDKVVGDLYFMGHDNGMIYNLIPLCAVCMIYSYLTEGRLMTRYTFFALFLSVFSEVYVHSATGIIEVTMLLILVVMYDNKYLRKIVTPGVLITTYLCFNVLIVFMKIQNYFAGFIVGVLGKDLTLTGRTVLWDFAVFKIRQNNFMGYGMGSEIPGANGHTYPHCHNLLLDFLYKGGLFSFICFIVLLVVFGKCYYRSSDKRISKIILIALFILLFGEITAACPYKVYFWSFFVLIQYGNELKSYFDTKNIERRR